MLENLFQFGHTISYFTMKNMLDSFNFLLKAVMIADPLNNPPIQRVEVHNLSESLNIIDKNNMRQVAALERNCNEILYAMSQ